MYYDNILPHNTLSQNNKRNNWICYLLQSLDNGHTYIGSTNNLEKRLLKHNKGKGAKRTRGNKWIPIIFISGFNNKNACLSFEKGWQKIYKNRRKNNFYMIYNNLKYTKDILFNRILDLLYFVYNLSFISGKFKLNRDNKYPFIEPNDLILHIFFEDWIDNLPWPYFINADSNPI